MVLLMGYGILIAPNNGKMGMLGQSRIEQRNRKMKINIFALSKGIAWRNDI